MAAELILGCAIFGGIGSVPKLVGRGDGIGSAMELMDTAWEGGIRSFDTADAYGDGASEAWIGEWVASTGLRPHVTTKTFNPMSPERDSGLSSKRIRRQVERSLERLGLEAIDLYLAHEFDPDVPPDETGETLENLKAEGMIRAYGVSNFTADQFRAFSSACAPTVIQNSFSLLNRGDEGTIMPLLSGTGIAYQAYSALAGGWLSGKYSAGVAFPPDSRLALVPEWYTHIEPEHAFAVVETLSATASTLGVAVPTLAISWAMLRPGVSGVVIGARTTDQLRAAHAAQELTRDEPALAQVVADMDWMPPPSGH